MDCTTLEYKYVFGPVRSSRLGLSLGLDLLGDAVCTMDCVYCEVGRTRMLTSERKPWVAAREILEELARWKEQTRQAPDYVTLGGQGEPTLNSDMGAVIEGVRDIFPDTPVAVLTNSTLMHDPEVRRQLALADAVLPSLDTLIPLETRRLNRPHGDVDFEALADGLMEFRREFSGDIMLEVLLAAGFNDSDANLDLLRDFVGRLAPNRVDVATMSRPGTVRSTHGVAAKTLAHWRGVLEPLAVGLVDRRPDALATTPRNGGARHNSSDAEADGNKGSAARPAASDGAALDRVAGSIGRRPQTAAQLAEALDIPLTDVQTALAALGDQGRLRSTGDGDETFYALTLG